MCLWHCVLQIYITNSRHRKKLWSEAYASRRYMCIWNIQGHELQAVRRLVKTLVWLLPKCIKWTPKSKPRVDQRKPWVNANFKEQTHSKPRKYTRGLVGVCCCVRLLGTVYLSEGPKSKPYIGSILSCKKFIINSRRKQMVIALY